MNNIITIGREFGSGGRELGKRLSEKLGYAYYDKEIIPEIAKRTDLAEKYVASIVDRQPIIPYPIHIGGSILPFYSADTNVADREIFDQQEQIIKEYAQKSDCVIVGRCADYILRDYDPLRIFVYAHIENRIERCRKKSQGNEDLSDRALRKEIFKIDRSRAAYYNFYSGQEWGNKVYYDLMINTSNFEIKDIVERLCKYL